MTRTMRLPVLLLAASFSWCCAATRAEQQSNTSPCASNAVQTVSQKRPVKTESPEVVTSTAVCNAPTKSGGKCTRRVKGGGYCFQHKDKVQ